MLVGGVSPKAGPPSLSVVARTGSRGIMNSKCYSDVVRNTIVPDVCNLSEWGWGNRLPRLECPLVLWSLRDLSERTSHLINCYWNEIRNVTKCMLSWWMMLGQMPPKAGTTSLEGDCKIWLGRDPLLPIVMKIDVEKTFEFQKQISVPKATFRFQKQTSWFQKQPAWFQKQMFRFPKQASCFQDHTPGSGTRRSDFKSSRHRSPLLSSFVLSCPFPSLPPSLFFHLVSFLFCSVLFCPFLFCSVASLFFPVLSCSVVFYLCSLLSFPFLSFAILLCSALLCDSLLCSVLVWTSLVCSDDMTLTFASTVFDHNICFIRFTYVW